MSNPALTDHGSRPFLWAFAATLLLAFSLVAGAVVLSAGRVQPYSSVGWTAHILRHRMALLDDKKSPSLIVVAGSSGLFSINASQIEAATGVPAINLSSHAAMPWMFFERMIFPRLESGDTLILPLEHGYIAEPTGGTLNTIAVEAAHSVGLRFLTSLDPWQAIDYLRLLSPRFVMGQFRPGRKLDMSRPSPFYAGIGPSHPNGNLTETDIGQFPDRVIKAAERMRPPARLAQNGAACTSIAMLAARGITVIGTPPSMYVPADRLEAFRALEPKLRAYYEQCGVRFVSDPSGGFQELWAMLDTPYHLTREARRLRTVRLVQGLCDQVLTCERDPSERR